MIFLLGIIIGLLIAVVCMLAIKRFQIPIERTIKQVGNQFKEKGEVFLPNEEREELENWVDNLPKV